MKPEAEMVATLTDLSFGPEGQFGDLYSRMLKESPESAKKFFPERTSDRKIRFEFAVVLQAADVFWECFETSSGNGGYIDGFKLWA